MVDDSCFARKTLVKLLKSWDCIVAGEASNGLEALHLFRMLRPEIVTIDINMPEMDGLELLRAIRLIDANVKVIVVSSMDQEPVIKEAFIAGAVDFLPKPIREENLYKALTKLVG